jgi:hypothetical protein
MRPSPHPVVGSARVPHRVSRAKPSSREPPVSSYKVEQCRVTYCGRNFHFVSYDHQPANERRGDPALPAMWYLMGPGKRWPVMPQIVGQADDDVERALVGWLQAQGLGRPTRAP